MEYITRHLTSDPGMDQREALVGLQEHPSFKAGSIVASIRNRKGQWVAEVLEPRTAADDEAPDSGGDDSPEPKSDAGPPAPDGGDEGGSNDSPPSPDGGDKPPADKGGEKPEGKGSTEEMILHTLTQILHALQAPGAGAVPGGPDAAGAGLPPGGPPPAKGPAPGAPPPAAKGGPPAGPAAGGSKFPPRPMKPGDTPPGGTPVGAPAFSSTRAANGVVPAQGTPAPGPAAPGQQVAAGVCPQDGNTEPCPVHSGMGQGLGQQVASFSGRASTITLTHDGTDIKAAVEQARPVVENFGYKVKQAKHSDDGTQVHILASRR